MDGESSDGGRVVAVSLSARHEFSKMRVARIQLLAGLGVEGDAHLGENVQHLSRVRADPSQPNLRQVHLIHGELFDELTAKGFTVHPSDLGENITTRGLALLDLPRGSRLHIWNDAELEVTGLRNPCAQIEAFQAGLLAAVLDRGADGELIRKAGIMAVVRHGGVVAAGDPIEVRRPPEPHEPLRPV